MPKKSESPGKRVLKSASKPSLKSPKAAADAKALKAFKVPESARISRGSKAAKDLKAVKATPGGGSAAPAARKHAAPAKPVLRDLATRKARAKRVGKMLDALYPAPEIPLYHINPFTLCIAVLMSAHTTDKSVNAVTPELFKIAPDAASMFKLGDAEILKRIRTVGLAPTKSRNIWNLSRILLEQHGGELPRTFEELEALPGVGHKTASVVMVQAFDHPAFPVDTHIHRLAERWGLSTGRNVEQTERDLKEVFPESTWGLRHLQIIYYGRERCPAQRHDLTTCSICSEMAEPAKPVKTLPVKNAKKA